MRTLFAVVVLEIVACSGAGPSGNTGSGSGGSAADKGSFNLSVGSTAITVRQNGVASVPVSITRNQGFAAPVELTVAGLSVGVAASPSPSIVVGTDSAVLLSATGAAAAGTSVVTLNAVSGSLTRSATVEVTVEADFSTGGTASRNQTEFKEIFRDTTGARTLQAYGSFTTDPASVPVTAHGTYIVEFDYQVLNPGSATSVLWLYFQPSNSPDSSQTVPLYSMPKNAPVTGTYSAGALTGDAANYVVGIAATSDSVVVIDNVRVLQAVSSVVTGVPMTFDNLERAPYPRLGNCNQQDSWHLAMYPARESPFTYSMDVVERRLAFSDVLMCMNMSAQTQAPDIIWRLRALNPNIVILPYRISEEQQVTPPPWGSSVDVVYDFYRSISPDWNVRTASGANIVEVGYDFIHFMNVSNACPVVGGQTFLSHEAGWITDTVFGSGLWDGIFLDNYFGHINPHIPNWNDGALLDFDINRNGIRDETPAIISDATREGARWLGRELRSRAGTGQLIVGNTGSLPELALAPYVNGFLFECFNEAWDMSWLPGPSEAGWRAAFDAYRTMQATTMRPRASLIEGCGRPAGMVNADHSYDTPTSNDIQSHRFTLATALLDGAFYEYDLFDAASAPYWFDEYSVNSAGVAVEDARFRGYLGEALGAPVELSSQRAVVYQQSFDGTAALLEMNGTPDGSISLSRAPGEVIAGSGSLVLTSADHANPSFVGAAVKSSALLLSPGTYEISFNWRVLETLDVGATAALYGRGATVDSYPLVGVVAGDSGRALFPLTFPPTGSYTFSIGLVRGAGKLAIDNLTVSRGGPGPWRRDFENGLVLVNPFRSSRTFSAAEIAGPLQRSGIRRILGTQAADVNSGQAVTGDLTLGHFDAIVLLADHIGAN